MTKEELEEVLVKFFKAEHENCWGDLLTHNLADAGWLTAQALYSVAKAIHELAEAVKAKD